MPGRRSTDDTGDSNQAIEAVLAEQHAQGWDHSARRSPRDATDLCPAGHKES